MKITDKHEILLAGLAVSTCNEAELSGEGKIAATVQQFYGEYLGRIRNRADDSVLAVYTDYESDEQGKYTYFIGAHVTDARDIPRDLTVHTIPAARYEVFTSKTGTVPQIVLEVWQNIWQDSALKKRRAFLADFEVYDERCRDRDNAQVDVYISVMGTEL